MSQDTIKQLRIQVVRQGDGAVVFDQLVLVVLTVVPATGETGYDIHGRVELWIGVAGRYFVDYCFGDGVRDRYDSGWLGAGSHWLQGSGRGAAPLPRVGRVLPVAPAQAEGRQP